MSIKCYHPDTKLKKGEFLLLDMRGGYSYTDSPHRTVRGSLIVVNKKLAKSLINDNRALVFNQAFAGSFTFSFPNVRYEVGRTYLDDRLNRGEGTMLVMANSSLRFERDEVTANDLKKAGRATDIDWTTVQAAVLSKETSLEFLDNPDMVLPGTTAEAPTEEE